MGFAEHFAMFTTTGWGGGAMGILKALNSDFASDQFVSKQIFGVLVQISIKNLKYYFFRANWE
jgi:hypothetical protein